MAPLCQPRYANPRTLVETESEPPLRPETAVEPVSGLHQDFALPMQTDGQVFLEHILFCSTNKFELRFSRIAARLDLGLALDARELSLLYEATFLATLCNLTLNGSGIFSSDGHREREAIRTMLEREFMCARNRFSRCAGLKKLSVAQKCSIESIFFKVLIAEENLAA